MVRTIIRRKFQLLVLLAGLGILALAACGSDAATASPDNTTADQQGPSAELLDLLRFQLGTGLVDGADNPKTSSSAGIWVNGQGQVSAEPDLAVLSLGVEALADTVAEARSNAASQMAAVVEVLRAQAVADRDIQTRSFNINPRYTTLEVTKCSSPDELEGSESESQSGSLGASDQECIVERERVIVGFEVTNQLTVRVRDLDSLSGVIDRVIEAGGDLIRFQGVSFTIEDTEELRDQARALAIEDLKRKAAQVADLAGVQLGQLLFITETGGRPTAVFAESAALAQWDASTPVLAGELDVVVSLRAAFDIEEPAFLIAEP